MANIAINPEISTINVSIAIMDCLQKLGVDTSNITIAELYQIKQGLIKGISKANEVRELTLTQG